MLSEVITQSSFHLHPKPGHLSILSYFYYYVLEFSLSDLKNKLHYVILKALYSFLEYLLHSFEIMDIQMSIFRLHIFCNCFLVPSMVPGT